MSAPVIPETPTTVAVPVDMLDSLIESAATVMAQGPAPTIVHGPVIAYGTVTTLAQEPPRLPAPATAPPVTVAPTTVSLDDVPRFIRPDRFWDNVQAMSYALVAMKWTAILGVAALLGFYIVWPVVSAVIVIVTFVSSIGALIGAAIPVVVVLSVAYWATSLLGFWDHAKPSRTRPPVTAPVQAPAPSRAKPSVAPKAVTVPKVKALPKLAAKTWTEAAPTPKVAEVVSVTKRVPKLKTKAVPVPKASIAPVAHLALNSGGAACGAPGSAHRAQRGDQKCGGCEDWLHGSVNWDVHGYPS